MFPETQICEYLSSLVCEQSFKPLKHCKDHASQWPLLTRMATCMLAVPASSAPFERVFSAGGRVMSIHHELMTADLLESQVCFKSWDHLFKRFSWGSILLLQLVKNGLRSFFPLIRVTFYKYCSTQKHLPVCQKEKKPRVKFEACCPIYHWIRLKFSPAHCHVSWGGCPTGSHKNTRVFFPASSADWHKSPAPVPAPHKSGRAAGLVVYKSTI